MAILKYYAASHSENEAGILRFPLLLCLSKSCVNLEVFCCTEYVMNVALKAVKRIQCRVSISNVAATKRR